MTAVVVRLIPFILAVLLVNSNTIPWQTYNVIYSTEEGLPAVNCRDSANCTGALQQRHRELMKRAFAFSNKYWKCHDLRCRRQVPPFCSHRGEEECVQLWFQCAEFVSRSLAAAGLLQNLDPYKARVRDLVRYEYNGVEYNIGFASRKHGMLGLKEFLEDQPDRWQKFTCTPFLPTDQVFDSDVNRNRTLSSGQCSADKIRPGSVLIMKNGRHSGVAVDFNKVNTHNPARFQRPFDEYTHFPINYIFSPIFT